jgi:polyhydroxyalkanoate synthesis regulator phasin
LSDIISRALLCGLGLASLSKDAIQKTAEDFIEQSKLSEEEGKRLLKEINKHSHQAQKTFDRKVEKAVNSALRGLNIAVVKLPAAGAKSAKKGPKRAAKRKA